MNVQVYEPEKEPDYFATLDGRFEAVAITKVYGDGSSRTDVFTIDFDCELFSVPGCPMQSELQTLLDVYYRGYENGFEWGKGQAQAAMRKALGL